jgi:hypothetical protein
MAMTIKKIGYISKCKMGTIRLNFLTLDEKMLNHLHVDIQFE